MLIILSDRVKTVNSSTKICLFKILFLKLLLPNISFLFIYDNAKTY